MSDGRKQIKITIPADKVEAFNEAKRDAEQYAMMKMTDTQYASRLFAWSLQSATGKTKDN